jgi:hypothetical protein
MRSGIRFSMLAVTALIAGCNGGALPVDQQTVLNGPHHGTTLQLSDQKGFIELVNEPQPRDRRSSEPTALVAYFLKMDAQSPLEPAPTDVSFAVDSGGGRGGRGRQGGAGQAIALAAEPKSDDPAGACRFASKPGPYQLANLRGTLNARIDGQAVSVTFAGGR